MARSSQPPPKQPAQLDRKQLSMGIDRLTKVLDRVRNFEPQSVTEQFNIPHVEQLGAAIDDALVRTFGKDSIEYDRYRYAAEFDNGPFNYAYEVPISDVHRSLARSKASSIGLLEQAIESLQDRLAEEEALAEPDDPPYAIAKTAPTAPSRKVFLVHGRDDAAKNEVALFLRKIAPAAEVHERDEVAIGRVVPCCPCVPAIVGRKIRKAGTKHRLPLPQDQLTDIRRMVTKVLIKQCV
jgi:hypothetical protein